MFWRWVDVYTDDNDKDDERFTARGRFKERGARGGEEERRGKGEEMGMGNGWKEG